MGVRVVLNLRSSGSSDYWVYSMTRHPRILQGNDLDVEFVQRDPTA